MDELEAEIDDIAAGVTSTNVTAPWSQQQTSPQRKAQTRNEQQDLHEKLKEYETKRRSVYSSKLDSMSLYWKSYQDLLSASLQETSRAERLVIGTTRAHELYSNAMQAIHDDSFLDEKGNVAKENQQKKLTAARTKSSQSRETKSTSVVKEIKESHQAIANKFGENAKNMDEEIAEAIQSLSIELKTQFSDMGRLGSSIIDELEKTEQEVTKAWGTYINATAISDNTMTSSPKETSSPKTGTESDPWIVEMQYRVSVAYQNTLWEKGNAELTTLFDQVKEKECARRMNLREFLVAFVQRQQRLFLSLPGIHNSVLEDLVGKEISLDEMEKTVQSTIDERAAKYSADLETLQNSGSQLITESAEDEKSEKYEFQQIESPLLSDLLCKAKVVERQVKGANTQGWQTTLAVITADSFLHLFDLESKSIIPGSSPEIAFKTLVPAVYVPTSESLSAGKANFSRGWGETLTPDESLVLANCSLQRKNETSFELMETITPKGMFGKVIVKKILINTSTKDEADDWIDVLTGSS